MFISCQLISLSALRCNQHILILLAVKHGYKTVNVKVEREICQKSERYPLTFLNQIAKLDHSV